MLPTSEPSALPAPRHGRRNRRAIALAVIGVAVVGGLAVNAVAGADDHAGYRTAAVRRSSVDQTVHDTGTVEPVSQVSVAFPVAGTVASIDVAVGAAVTTGQQLATLDGAALQRSINTARSTLDQAELALEQARNGEVSGAPSSGGSTGGAFTGASFDTGSGSATIELASATQSIDDAIGAAQDQVLSSQQDVDRRISAAQDALDSAQAICAAVGDDDGTQSLEGAAATDPGSGTPADEVAPSATIAACRSALTDVLAAQQSVSDAQTALSQAARTLDDLLAERAASAQDDGGSGGGAGTGGSSLPDRSGDGASGSTGSSEGTVSSADLIAYQRAVDAAEAKLAVAQQALEQATIVSPIEGTVTAVDLAVGDSVEAASTTARILVEGPGGYEVTTTLAVDQLPKVKLGQSATVVPDGSDQELTGKVVSIGLAATSSSSGVTTYPVTVSLDDDAGLRNGSVASVDIVTKAASDALVVPTSAVRASGGTHSVIVLEGGKPTTKDVQIGAVGATWTEIESGLAEGQEVVIADLDEALPSSATSSADGGGNGGGNLRIALPGGGAAPFGRQRG
jgi:HlyD family secretion protein